jgi:hypothetical protein
VKESAIEAACCRHARQQGVRAIKLQVGITGEPDRLFLLPGRRCWLVEFKALGGRLSPRQHLVHADLAGIGHPVTVVRSTAEFKAALVAELGA